MILDGILNLLVSSVADVSGGVESEAAVLEFASEQFKRPKWEVAVVRAAVDPPGGLSGAAEPVLVSSRNVVVSTPELDVDSASFSGLPGTVAAGGGGGGGGRTDAGDLDAALDLGLFCSELGGLNLRLAALLIMALKRVGDFEPTSAAEVFFTGQRAAAAGKEPVRRTVKLCVASADTGNDRFLLGSSILPLLPKA